MPFLKIPYRDYPKEGLFKKLYRENIYKIEEFKDEFKYYEYTPIEKIIIDEHNLVPFIFFSPEGINYLMPKIIDSISNGIKYRRIYYKYTCRRKHHSRFKSLKKR